MAYPFNYGVASFVISNINNSNDSDNEFGDEISDSNDFEEDTSEISIPTDIDTSAIDSDNEALEPEMSNAGDDDSSIQDSVTENNVSQSLVETDSDHESEVEPVAKRIKLDDAEQSDGNESVDSSQKCPICLGAWTTAGNHRLCSLRCGHIFGYKCIKQWLNSDNESAKRCPHCNARASVRHIRFLYANHLTSLDTNEIESMKRKLEEAQIRVSKAAKALCKEKKRTKKYKQMYKARTLALTADSDFCFSD